MQQVTIIYRLRLFIASNAQYLAYSVHARVYTKRSHVTSCQFLKTGSLSEKWCPECLQLK